jgi:hypothetical protein
MSDTFYIKRGDTLFFLEYVLDGPTGLDLTGAAVLFKMRARNGALVFSRAGTVAVATGTPTVAYAWQAGDTATAGLFEGEFEITFPGGRIKTFPDPGFIPIRISEDIS